MLCILQLINTKKKGVAVKNCDFYDIYLLFLLDVIFMVIPCK